MSLKEHLCDTCIYRQLTYFKSMWASSGFGYPKYYPPEEAYTCEKRQVKITRVVKRCKHYLNVCQQTLKVVNNGMVKLSQIPSEGERLELTDLPDNIELIATSENFKEAEGGKAGGLVINYMLRDKRHFSQKYTKLSGIILMKALKKLGIKDTKELQKDWYTYKLTPMRMGFPRMISFLKVIK